MAELPYYIKPTPGFVICKPLKENKVSGVYISDNMATKDSAGVVIAVGADYVATIGNAPLMAKSPVKVGDKIIFANYGDNKYLDFRSGEHVYVVRFHPDPVYNQVLGVINDE